MKNGAALFFFFFFCICSKNSSAQPGTYNPGKVFSISQLKDDFTILRTTLEKRHANLYLYTSKQRLDSIFDSLYNGINRPMTEPEFYKHITFLSSQIKNGHSYILPAQEARDNANKVEKFFPLHITWIDSKMYVDMNCTSDSTIKDGAEIMSINGIAAADVMAQLLQRQVRDGNNETYPLWILNNWFREYYSYTYGNPAEFSITYKLNGNETKTGEVKALSKDSIRFYMQQKYAARVTTKKEGQGVYLVENSALKAAILTVKTFDDDELNDDYSQNFRSAIYDYFEKIKKNNIQNLILDLRDNQGGDPENGILLLSWLLDTSFTMIYKGPSSGMHKPVKEPYKGKLYVLVNGGSFSTTGMVSSCLDLYKRSIFIGQETGGNKYIQTGDPDGLELPATKIHCEISTTPYVLRAQYNNDGHGVMPLYNVIPSIEDIIKRQDRVQQYAMGLIRDEK